MNDLNSNSINPNNNPNNNNSNDKRKLTDQQLNNSLTSMEWLFPLSALNKPPANLNNSPKLKIPGNMLPIPIDLSPNQINQQSKQPELHENGVQQKNQFVYKSSPVNHSVAQRAEPHRPIDLNAEYKCADPVKREGKPPYSYVNLCTFAINSSPKKKMTLNEIYQWISDNFSFYKITANGWKVSYCNLW